MGVPNGRIQPHTKLQILEYYVYNIRKREAWKPFPPKTRLRRREERREARCSSASGSALARPHARAVARTWRRVEGGARRRRRCRWIVKGMYELSRVVGGAGERGAGRGEELPICWPWRSARERKRVRMRKRKRRRKSGGGGGRRSGGGGEADGWGRTQEEALRRSREGGRANRRKMNGKITRC